MSDDQREVHDQLIQGFIADLNPAGVLETTLAKSVAEDNWRLDRARALEENMYTLSNSDLDVEAAIEANPLLATALA